MASIYQVIPAGQDGDPLWATISADGFLTLYSQNGVPLSVAFLGDRELSLFDKTAMLGWPSTIPSHPRHNEIHQAFTIAIQAPPPSFSTGQGTTVENMEPLLFSELFTSLSNKLARIEQMLNTLSEVASLLREMKLSKDVESQRAKEIAEARAVAK